MKARRFHMIMISGYLSAMLSSGVPTVRNDMALAGATGPNSARQALQSAIDRLNAEGSAPSVTTTAAVAVPTTVLSAIPDRQAAGPTGKSIKSGARSKPGQTVFARARASSTRVVKLRAPQKAGHRK